MRDLSTKMAELKFEAPLAKFEESDEWGGCDFISSTQHTVTQQQRQQQNRNDTLNLNLKKDASAAQNVKLQLLEEAMRDAHISKNGLPAAMQGGDMAEGTAAVAVADVGGNGSGALTPNCNTQLAAADFGTMDMFTLGTVAGEKRTDSVDNFTEAFGGSLEDLVNTFDEKITKCFGNYEENVEALAPVQVRSQEEIMNECQMWWTITGNFGNILPIDWSKTYTRRMHLPTLLQPDKNAQSSDVGGGGGTTNDEFNDLSSEDEAVANDLDMHSLILNGMSVDQYEPIKSVEEVIKEIDDIMDEAESPLEEPPACDSEVMEKAKEVLGASMHAEKLQYFSMPQLNELYMEMEMLIQEFSETLINELALRDELEFEKELKNSFISLLLAVQNKRRQYHVEKKRGKLQGPEPKYLTTVIPYHLENGTPNNQSLQVLIKILKAINEDSPTVPALLTDYILKVLCPT